MDKHKSDSAAACMHRYTLQWQSPCAGQAYYRQFEALDLINCLIAPLFFANALSMFSADLLSSIYCAVLLIKGYQAGLLLLPAARQQGAHERSRYWLILAERVLRQWFATPLLGRGPRFQGWILAAAEASSKLMFCCKTLVLISGASISWWNAFCLPLDFTSHAVLTSVFFAIHFQASVAQVAYPFQVLVQCVPCVLAVQQSIEYVLQKALKHLHMPLVLGSARFTTSSSAGLAGVAGAGPALGCSSVMMSAGTSVYKFNTASELTPVLAAATESDLNGSEAAALGVCPNQPMLSIPATSVGGLQFEQPGRAPDVTSLAGRFILATSAAYMLLVVLILPLYVAWNLERHWKSKFLAQWPGLQRQMQQKQLSGASAVAEQLAEAHCPSAAAGCSASNRHRSSCTKQTSADVAGQSRLQEQGSAAKPCEMLLVQSALMDGGPCPAAQAADQLFTSSEDRAAAAACSRISKSKKLAAQIMHPAVPQADYPNSSVGATIEQLHSSGEQLGRGGNRGMHSYQVASIPVIHALPKGKVLCQQLAILVGISFGCGQALVLLLNLFPMLTCLFWQQIIF